MPAASTSSSRTTRTRSRRAASAFGHAIMAKYWMHNGFLNISGEKMSKSLGNFFTVHELLDQYPGEAIRLLLLSAQYRQPLDFTHEGLTQAKAHARPLVRRCCAARRWRRRRSRRSVEDALSDDLNTPLAIAAMHQLRDPSELQAGRRRRSACCSRIRSLVPLDAGSRCRRSVRCRDRGRDRGPSGRAQGQGLQGVRPHSRRSQGQRRDPRGRTEGHDLEARLAQRFSKMMLCTARPK